MASSPPSFPSLPASQGASLQTRVQPAWFLGAYDAQADLIISIAGVLTVVAVYNILVHLFSHILDSCLDIWAQSPPSNQVAIQAGFVRLEFGCSMRPVPWEFLEGFARSHIDAVNRGFAPIFAREWWFDSQDRGRFCYAGLRIVSRGGEGFASDQD